MWTKIKWGLRITILLIVAAFLHYTLPQRDIVYITDTRNQITTIGANWMFYAIGDTGSGQEGQLTRDILFIDAAFEDGSVMVYRNEDTGWVWPPYFKYDSSNLQAEAGNMKSSAAAKQWVAVTHYGWRLPIFSAFPNAVKITPVSGPEVRLIPWVNIVILTALAFLLFMLRRMWLQFRERMIDPAMDDVNNALDAMDARADAARAEARGIFGRFSAWLGTWKGKPRR